MFHEVTRHAYIFVVGLKLVKKLGQPEIGAQVRNFRQNLHHLQFERRDCRRHRRELVPVLERRKRLNVFEIGAAIEDRDEESKKVLDLVVSRLKTITYKRFDETNLMSNSD